MKRLTEREFTDLTKDRLWSKDDIMKRCVVSEEGCTYDTALPQHWLDSLSKVMAEKAISIPLPTYSPYLQRQTQHDYYEYIRTHCVWVYDTNGGVYGQAFFMTEEANEAWEKCNEA